MSPSDPTLTVDTVAFSVSSAVAAAEFFIEVLDGTLVANDQSTSDGRTVTVRLGRESLTLVESRPPGRPAPLDSHSNDLWFQHVALVVSDMDAACGRLRAAGVEAISSAPQRLPDWNPAAGGIQAFYFLGPDRHPLELISFPPGKGDARWQSTEAVVLGIDHTAIAVSSTVASLRFYRDELGLSVAGESENWGTEQESLSGVEGARVRITGLRGSAGPGVEFLEYLSPRTGKSPPANTAPGDLWYVETRCTTNDLDGIRDRLLSSMSDVDVSLGGGIDLVARDPDGHVVRISEPR